MPLHDTAFGTIEALQWGDGDETVVLLHALGAGPAGFAPLAGRLLRPGRRILAPALHGYGRTCIRAAAGPVEAHVTVARWALASAGGRPVLLFGHSMGGLTALLAAAGRDDVAALVLFEPIVHAALEPGDPADRALAAAERAMIRGVADAVARDDPETGLAAFFDTWNEAPWAALPDRLRGRLLADAGRFARETEAVAAHRVPEGLWRRVAAPATVLHGDRSPPLAARMARRLAGRLPGACARPLAGLGHMAPVLAPDSLAAAIEAAATPPQVATSAS